MIKITTFVLFFLGLIYLIYPGPSNINDIPPLPDSTKSQEPGDTKQNPNIAAYFSNHRRQAVTAYYRDSFSYLNFFGFKIPAFRSNHPPEEGFSYIRDQIPSTYLEQYYYPLRDAIFVNGFEPFDEGGKLYRLGATTIVIDGTLYQSKTTVRYYPSPAATRVLIYIFIWVAIFWLIKVTKKVIKE